MTTILKPESPSRIWRKTRRKRPQYPSLNAGESIRVEREECGEQYAKGQLIGSKSFVYGRSLPSERRSKYGS